MNAPMMPPSSFECAREFAMQFPVSKDEEIPTTVPFAQYDQFAVERQHYSLDHEPDTLSRMRRDSRDRITRAATSETFEDVTGLPAFVIVVVVPGELLAVLPVANAVENKVVALPRRISSLSKTHRKEVSRLQKRVNPLALSARLRMLLEMLPEEIDEGFEEIDRRLNKMERRIKQITDGAAKLGKDDDEKPDDNE